MLEGAVDPKGSVVADCDLVPLLREFFCAAVKEHNAPCLLIVDVGGVAGVDAPVGGFDFVETFGVLSNERAGHENVSGGEKVAFCADGEHLIIPLSVVE